MELRTSAAPRREIRLLSVQDDIAGKLQDFLAESPAPEKNLPWDVGRLVQEIHDHAFEDLNVSDLLSRCRIRGNNASTRFRWAVGLGPRAYLERLRIEAACRLLGQGDFAIYMIGMSVGYSYQETFCRAFQRRMGCTPSAYRRGQGTDVSSSASSEAGE